MADRFWVGGTGTWSTVLTTNWSATSGGAGGASVPTAADSVFFNQAATYTVTMTGALLCLDITVSAGVVTFAQGTSPTLAIMGSMSLLAGTVWNVTGSITFNSTATGKTITTNGVIIKGGVTFNGSGGGWTLGSALTTSGDLTLTTGTLDTSAAGNYAVTCNTVSQISGLPSALNLNASTITVVGTTFSTSGAGLTLNAGTSQINCSSTSSSITFNGGSRTFYNVSFTSAPIAGIGRTITGNNVFNNLAFVASTTSRASFITFGGNQTINGTFTGSGTSAIIRLFYSSSVLGTARTLTLANATTLTNCDFRDITAVTNAITATGGGDCGGNTNITGFPAAKTVYWNLTGTQNWSATAWATSSGGTPALANFPLAQDTAVFDNTGAATTVNQGAASWNIGTLDMSLRTTAVTFSTASGGPNVYGSWLNGTGVTISGTIAILFVGRGNTQQVFGNGRSFTQSITVQNVGGTMQLTGALTLGATNTFTLTNGTLDLQSYTLTTGLFSSSNSNLRSIAFGTGNLTLSSTTGTIFITSANNFTVSGTRTVNVTNNTASAITVVSGASTEVGAVDINILAGTYALNLGSTPGIRDLDFTGFSGSCTLSGFTNLIFGDLTLSATATYPASTGTMQFSATSGSKTITTSNKTLDFAVTFNGIGGTWVLQDALTMGSTRTLTHTNGTLDLSGKTLTVGTAYTTATGTKNLTFNGGTLACPAVTTTAFNNAVPTGFTTTAGTGVGTISMTGATAKTFVGGGSTFNCTLNQGGAGALTITGANTFSDITNTVQPASVLFTVATTNTFAAFSLSGTAGNLITIASTSTGVRATVSDTSGVINISYCAIQDIAATGGATWNSLTSNGCVDNGNNTGWIFSSGISVNVSVTGQSATVSVGIGTVVASARAPPIGVEASATIDGVGVSAGGNISVDPNDAVGTGLIGAVIVNLGAGVVVTGVSASGSIGSVSATGAANFTPTGVSATASVGTVTAGVVALVNVTGVSASGLIGTASVTGKANVTLTGIEATASAGTVAVGIFARVAITGVEATASVGTALVAANCNTSVSGVSASGSVGDVTSTSTANVTPTGVSASGAVGTVATQFSYYVTGVSATGAIGTTSIQAGARVYVTGVQAVGIVQSVLVWGQINDNQNADWQPIDDTQSGGWVVVNDNQTPTWTAVDDSQTVTWTQVNDGSTVTWVAIPT